MKLQKKKNYVRVTLTCTEGSTYLLTVHFNNMTNFEKK